MTVLAMIAHAVPAERAVMIEAARQLAACLDAASGATWSVALAFEDDGSHAAIRIVSLAGAVTEAAPIAALAERWHVRLAAWRGPIVVTTLFRLADPTLIARIRRLNALAIELSRVRGIEVADVDSACALLGTGAVRSDWRLDDPHAALVAGHTIVAAMLAADLSALLPPDLQARARAIHGSLADLIARHPRRAA